ncbi:MAG: hypothetical protein KC983_12475, partial [Phycisphaerales bacterium]|nr:hypothetical protein [Phycisphaerales bacterium]
MTHTWWFIPIDWLGWLLIFGGLFGGWILRPRWRTHPRECPKCRYDLSHTDGLRCSECGYTALRERTLHGLRKRWRIATAGLLVLLTM